MLFSELAESQLPGCLEDTIKELFDLKMNLLEVKMIPRIDILNEYMDWSIAGIRELVQQYPKERTRDWEKLNRLFPLALKT